MNTWELNPSRALAGKQLVSAENDGFNRAMLIDNVRWFIRLRWGVVATLVLLGLAGRLCSVPLLQVGISAPQRWPFVLASVLAAANVGFLFLAARLHPKSSRLQVHFNLWCQIVVDLVILTILVHLVGSTETAVSFLYLLHIVLACVFFSRRQSFLVLVLASLLYGMCVAWEMVRILPRWGHDVFQMAGYAGSAIALWLAVWYLASKLSQVVQKRDQQLSSANEQLQVAHDAKNQQMLQTAHDLKAPFSGIESNIEILRTVHWHEIPEAVQLIIERIHVRAMTLSERIKDILILGDLRSANTQNAKVAPVDLSSIFRQVIEDLADKAKERDISIQSAVDPEIVSGDARQMLILFSNLVANAVIYSQPGKTVEIETVREPGRMIVRVIDHGIGIRAESLSQIFDEHYRTQEGARFNKLSTGFGLAIVRQVANNLGFTIRVTSELDNGSTFEVIMPLAQD